MAKLKNTKDDDKTLSHYVLHRVIGDEAIFVVSPPYAGEFGLEIYANDPETGGQSLLHAYQYLLICKDPASPVQPFPVLPAGQSKSYLRMSVIKCADIPFCLVLIFIKIFC